MYVFLDVDDILVNGVQRDIHVGVFHLVLGVDLQQECVLVTREPLFWVQTDFFHLHLQQFDLLQRWFYRLWDFSIEFFLTVPHPQILVGNNAFLGVI